MTAWKYSTTLKGSSTDCPTLSLAAAAPVASSLDTLLASSVLRLDVRVLADGQQLDAASLEGSALAREVRGWFDKSQSPELASQTQLSQPPEVTLTSHLLSPSSLHFTLVPQLATALERLAKKLVVAFPLCFNPRWQDRLANDLPAHHSIAQSLCNILGLDGRKEDLRKPHDSEVEKKAGLLELTLKSHITARYPSHPSLASSSSATTPSTHATTTSLETALLLIAKNASAPDAWTSAKAGSADGEDGAGKKGRKASGAGKRKAKDAEGNDGGAAVRKKRKTSKSRTDDADDLPAFSTELHDPSSSTLASGSLDEEDGQGEGSFEADLGGEEPAMDEGWDLFGDAWA